MHRHIKSVPIFLLAMAMLFTSAYASDISAPGTGSSTATVSQTASVISVSVPTGLPVTVTSDGTVNTSTDAKIVNNSYGPIKVSNIQLNGANSWSLVDYTTNFKALKVGLKQFGFQLQGENVPNTGLVSLTGFTSINGGAELPITYSAKVGIQSSAITNDVGNLVITISWDKAEAAKVYGVVPANVTDYYTFIDDTSTTGGWKIELNASFETALQANSGAGSIYQAWNPGDPLPNPGSTYSGTPVTSMEVVFAGCPGLTSINLSNWDTTNIKNMDRMFVACPALTSIDLSSFNTTNVTLMNGMFQSCTSLTSLDISGFNTAKVTGMCYLFYGCSSLTSIVLSSFDTSNVTDMSSMFYNCTGLTSINVSNFNTNKVTNINNMFNTCSGLTSLDLSSFDMTNVTNASYMFQNCTGITTAYAKTINDANKFNTSTFKPAGLTFTVK